MASDYASAKLSSQEEQQYYILLILTDGIINDMEVEIRTLSFDCYLVATIFLYALVEALDLVGEQLEVEAYGCD